MAWYIYIPFVRSITCVIFSYVSSYLHGQVIDSGLEHNMKIASWFLLITQDKG